jgi:inner membrane protein involved in colicin E2 resistance
MVLGGTIWNRTQSSGQHTRGSVQSIWGSPQIQVAPSGNYTVEVPYEETVEEKGVKRVITKSRVETWSFRPSASDVNVDLGLTHRQKGLMWYATYTVGFRGDFEFVNTDKIAREVNVTLPFPASQTLYDDLQFQVNGQVAPVSNDKTSASTPVTLAPGQTAKVRITYRSQGLDSWRYSFGQDVTQVNNFHLRMKTDFKDIDFPDNTLSASVKTPTNDGWLLDWNYKSLLSGYQIAMTMPEALQPGPLAAEISFFAPVSLFFFFFVLFLITTLRSIELHPMNYFFLAGAFFAFHLLLAYLADHVDIRAAFAIASVVSVFLVVTYLRLVVGPQFALREAAIAQFLYLVLFSFAFFFKGFTGLSVTIGSIVTLFVAMQMTARIRWADRFSPSIPPLPAQ